MTPQEQQRLPWTLLQSSDVEDLRGIIPTIETAVREGRPVETARVPVGCALNLRMVVTAVQPEGEPDPDWRVTPNTRHHVHLQMHPSLIEGDGPRHPWDAGVNAVAEAFLRVLKAVVDAPKVDVPYDPFPEGGPSNDVIEDPDLEPRIALDPRTALDAARLEETSMPKAGAGTTRATIIVATPLGTGGLSISRTDGPAWSTDASERYIAIGAVDVRTHKRTLDDGRQYLETVVSAPIMRADVPRLDAIGRMRLEAAEAERNRRDRP
jgi:hypothetical protein